MREQRSRGNSRIPPLSQRPAPTNTMPETIKLFCLVQGDDLNRAFLVRMQPTDTISDLKEVIQSKKPSFKEIAADTLQLWKASEWYLHVLTRKI